MSLTSSNRLMGVTVTKSIILGCYTFLKSGGTEGASSYRWTMLIRSGEKDDEDEDLSEYIRRVEFNLHSTFAQPKRVVESPPFQVEEQGWGEFEVSMRIYFQDINERPLEVKHWLKLRPSEGEDTGIDYSVTPLVSEVMDEIVFTSPHEWFYEKLTKPASTRVSIPGIASMKISDHPLRPWMKSVDDFVSEEESDEKKLLEIEKFLKVQISNHQSQILLVDSDYRAYRDHFYKYNLT